MSRPTCSTCGHFFSSALEQVSQCRVKPPQATLAGMNNQGQPLIITFFPSVRPDTEYCGMHWRMPELDVPDGTGDH